MGGADSGDTAAPGAIAVGFAVLTNIGDWRQSAESGERAHPGFLGALGRYNAGMDRAPRPRMSPKPNRDVQPPKPRRNFIGWLSMPPMRYQNAYVWLVFFSAMDVMLTWRILQKGGTEVNPIAKQVLDYWGSLGEHWVLWVAIGFKFCLMLFVIVTCEIVGRKREKTARWLARAAVGISAFPVVYSLWLLSYHTFVIERAGQM